MNVWIIISSFFCYYYQNRVYLSQKLWILLLCIYRGVGCTVYLSFSGDSSKDSGRIWSPGHICHCSTNFQFKGEHGRPVRDMYCYFYKLLFSPNEALTETTVLPFWINLMWACREREREREIQSLCSHVGCQCNWCLIVKNNRGTSVLCF